LSTHDVSEIMSKDVTAILPGYQYVWNIHSARHIHIFHSILANDGPWYFGCVAEELSSRNPICATLLRITDHRFLDEDGRIVLAVQGLDRCRVVGKHGATSDLQIWPEEELVTDKLNGALESSRSFFSSMSDEQLFEGMSTNQPRADHATLSQAAIAASAAECYRCRKFEYAPVYLTEKPKGPDKTQALQSKPRDSNATKKIKDAIRNQEETKYETVFLSITELVNYDAFAYPSLIDASAVNSQALKNFWKNMSSKTQTEYIDEEVMFSSLMPEHGSKAASFTVDTEYCDQSFSTSRKLPPTLSSEGVEMMEWHLWKSLDEMIRLLNMAASANVPLSSQLLSLLPKRNDWPPEFVLEEYAKSLAMSGNTVDTAFSSPCARIDDVTKRNVTSTNNSTNYPSLRRALRLSHAIWMLLDGLAVSGFKPPPPTRAEVLAMESIGERLATAKAVLDGVNRVLRTLIPHIKKDGDGNQGGDGK
jgi:hypothetical protein